MPDVAGLCRILATHLDLGVTDLEPLSVRCAWPVFRGRLSDGRQVFVKLVRRDFAERTLRLLAALRPTEFLPRPVLTTAPAFGDAAVLCLEWKETSCVPAERMTDGQCGSFIAACRRLSGVLSDYADDVRPLGEESPESLYAVVKSYARRHPVVARLIRPLIEIPEADRSYHGRACVTIHGDFQPRNYGFKDEELAAVFDFDALTTGLACEDAAYAFTERARRSELTGRERRRLEELFARVVADCGWPIADWRLAVAHARLRIAARRLAKHPNSAFVAIDIARRDRGLRSLADLLARLEAEEGDEAGADVRKVIGRELGAAVLSLRRLTATGCVSKVYRALLADGRTVFAKSAEEQHARTVDFLASVHDCRLVTAMLVKPQPCGGRWISAQAWCEARHIPLSEMSEAQFASFERGFGELRTLLQRATEVDAPIDGEALSGEVEAYRRRHPLARWILPLSFRGDATPFAYPVGVGGEVIHGDFHAENFGFSGDEMSVVYDFDLIRRGSYAEDLAFLALENVKRSGLSRAGRQRLVTRMRKLIADSGRSLDEWRTAFNRIRLVAVVKLIRRHPDRLRTAILVARRDRRFTAMMEDVL